MTICADIIHSGHFNCIRQAKQFTDHLIVGLIADEEILRSKGPPVMNQDERGDMIKACKWADEVLIGTEYHVNVEILNRLNCDYCVHGDDIAINKATGKDAYAEVREAGMLRVVKRTEGISTTDMVGKMLLMTQTEKTHEEQASISEMANKKDIKYLQLTRRIAQFASKKSPTPEDKIVYVDGSWDLLHRGHVALIRKAKELGTYLIVGVHDDQIVNQRKGKNYPIMNSHERALNLLALRYVDDVIIGAPWIVNEDLISSLNIQVVAEGTLKKATSYDPSIASDDLTQDPYAYAKEKGIYAELESEHDLDAEKIVARIVENRLEFIDKAKRQGSAQENYYLNKEYMPET